MRIKSRLPSLSILLLLVFSVGLFHPSFVIAQASEKEKAEKELERRQELERKTLRLLDEIVVGSWSLKLPENRAFVLTTAADLLWPHDEKRARNLFWEALNNIASPISQAGDEAKTRSSNTKDQTPKGDNSQRLKDYYATFATRQEFLTRAARRDPQLALDMLRGHAPTASAAATRERQLSAARRERAGTSDSRRSRGARSQTCFADRA